MAKLVDRELTGLCDLIEVTPTAQLANYPDLGRARVEDLARVALHLERLLLAPLWQLQSKSRRSSSVQAHPSEVDALLWRDREIDLIDMPLDAYFDGLERHLEGFDNASVPR